MCKILNFVPEIQIFHSRLWSGFPVLHESLFSLRYVNAGLT